MYENVFYTGEYTIGNNVLLYRSFADKKTLITCSSFHFNFENDGDFLC